MEKVEFQIGDEVVLKVNPERRGMITGILFRFSGVCYLVTWGENAQEQYHYAIELREATHTRAAYFREVCKPWRLNSAFPGAL
ncbi:MAG: hypothetical protein AB1705_25140 [Verrucomicrobiota bacterium]